MVAQINTEVVMEAVTAITTSMEKIKTECEAHSQILSDLSNQTNIKPINSLSKSFDGMLVSCRAAAEASSETLEKTRRYVDEANEIDTDEGDLFSE